ncbi:MAG: hypothetical protein KU37_02340 [Sulfuricurvum sp. PC08-66]|nr:MAG: hypothetical protein KU37_02340 [Sulfuricurvum sp. PC08-66]
MRKLLPLFVLLLTLHAEDNATQNFEAIEVKGANENSLFATPEYLKTQTYIENAPAQKAFTITEAMSIPGVMSDPLKALQTLAGVSTASSFSGELLIHGSKAYETFYTYNYMPLGYVFHFGGLHSVISPDAIEQLNLYLGAFDVTYGNAMGGVVDITPKLPIGSGHGHVHVGLFDASASIDVPLGDKVALYVGGRRSYFDVFLGILNPQIEGFDFTTYPAYYDLTTILAYRPDDYNTLSFEAIVANDVTDLTTQEASPCNPDFVGQASTKQSFRTYGMRWMYDNYTNLQSNTVLAYTAKKDATDVFSQIKSEENFHDFKLTHLTSLTLDAHKLTAGVDATNYYHPYDYKITTSFLNDTPTDDINETNNTLITVNLAGEQIFPNYAGFVQDIWDITDWLKVRYGVRGNYTPYQNFGGILDPRGAIILSLGQHSLSFATGQYSQYPVLMRTIDAQSGSALGYEKSIHYAFNYKYTFEEGHSIEIEPYHKEYTSLSVQKDANTSYFYTRSQSIFNFMNEAGLGYAQGVDITYKLRRDNLYLFSTYSYLDAKRQYFLDGGLIDFESEIPQTLQVAASYDLQNNWVVGGLMRYHTGAYTKRPTSEINASKVAGETCYRSDSATEVKERLPDYFTLNLKATYTQPLEKESRIEYSFEFMNVTAHENLTGYRVDSKTGKIGKSLDVLSFPFLPWFDVTYRF